MLFLRKGFEVFFWLEKGSSYLSFSLGLSGKVVGLCFTSCCHRATSLFELLSTQIACVFEYVPTWTFSHIVKKKKKWQFPWGELQNSLLLRLSSSPENFHCSRAWDMVGVLLLLEWKWYFMTRMLWWGNIPTVVGISLQASNPSSMSFLEERWLGFPYSYPSWPELEPLPYGWRLHRER